MDSASTEEKKHRDDENERENGSGREETNDEEGGDEDDPEDEDEEFLKSPDVREDSEVLSLRALLTVSASALDFIRTVTKAVGLVQELVQSKTASDVVEAVRFFVRAVNFNLNGTKKGLQR
jgi:hypothetical protein